jgi:hypothetical protein
MLTESNLVLHVAFLLRDKCIVSDIFFYFFYSHKHELMQLVPVVT